MKQRPVSATYIKMFLQCPLKFYYRYYDKKTPIEGGDARAFGTAVHHALEKVYERLTSYGRRPHKDDYDYALKEFTSSAIDNGLIDQSLYEEGRNIIRSRLDKYKEEGKVIALELKFGFSDSKQVYTSGGTPYIGAIDKLLELDKDTIVIVDYKTSRTALTEDEAATDEQLSLYDAVVSKLFPQYKNRILVLDYLRLSPVITYRTQEQRQGFELFVDTVYEKIGALKEEEIRPVLNEFCGWCDYSSYCPKYQQAITDPDIKVQQLSTMSNKEFVGEWERFSNIKRIIDSYDRDLKLHVSKISQGGNERDLVGEEKTLYRVQNTKASYNVKTVLDTVPIEDCPDLLYVKKTTMDKYLVENPKLKEKIESTLQLTYTTPFFKLKKNK